jgi:hypothetical protein
MIFFVAFLGLVIGFLTGQLILVRLLKGYTKDELLNNKKLHKYGLLNWVIALAISWFSTWLYSYYF